MAKDKDSLLHHFSATITEEQQAVLDAILAPVEEVNQVWIDAKAGTGKTQVAVLAARLREVNMRYIFAPVNEDLQGFLPGDLDEKSNPYLPPLKQALIKIGEKPDKCIFNDKTIEGMQALKNGQVWVYAHPHTYERGVNYENETVIIEEAQNFTEEQLRKVLTRPHDNCKVIVIGSTLQCDLPDSKKSGFRPYYERANESWQKRLQLTKNFRGRMAQWADSF